MDTQLINRVGIVFSFLGGFLIAPELLGIQRIKKLETAIEHILLTARSWLDDYLSNLKDAQSQPNFGSRKNVSIDTLLFLIIVEIELLYGMVLLAVKEYYGLTMSVELIRIILIASVLVWATISLFIIGSYFHYAKNSTNVNLYDLIGMIFFTPIYIGLCPIIIFFAIFMLLIAAVFIAILFCFYGIINILLKSLLGNDILQSVFIWTGIIMLILGSAFQFIGTF